MRKNRHFLIFLFSLVFTACSSQSEYEPKRPTIQVERPEISFELIQVSGGAMKIRMTNNGKTPFRYYDHLSEASTSRGGFPVFRICEQTRAECSGAEWINPNIKSSYAILIPTELSELAPGGSITETIEIERMLAMGGVYAPKPGDRVQIKERVMLTEYFEEFIEYVSEWIPLETLMR